ncbi:hypothetical protein KKH3_09550 [Pectobacterium actinidiae]|nr:hypothetical protein KKH3_09550 [Pectobacterium actinidiae]
MDFIQIDFFFTAIAFGNEQALVHVGIYLLVKIKNIPCLFTETRL